MLDVKMGKNLMDVLMIFAIIIGFALIFRLIIWCDKQIKKVKGE